MLTMVIVLLWLLLFAPAVCWIASVDSMEGLSTGVDNQDCWIDCISVITGLELRRLATTSYLVGDIAASTLVAQRPAAVCLVSIHAEGGCNAQIWQELCLDSRHDSGESLHTNSGGLTNALDLSWPQDVSGPSAFPTYEPSISQVVFSVVLAGLDCVQQLRSNVSCSVPVIEVIITWIHLVMDSTRYRSISRSRPVLPSGFWEVLARSPIALKCCVYSTMVVDAGDDKRPPTWDGNGGTIDKELYYRYA